MNIYVQETLISYTNPMSNVIVNNIIRPFLNGNGIHYWVIYLQQTNVIWSIWDYQNPNVIKPFYQFSKVLNVWQNNSVRRLGANKSKRKAIIPGSLFWYGISKRQRHTEIDKQVKMIFTIGLYNILIFFSPQSQMIALKCLFAVILIYS